MQGFEIGSAVVSGVVGMGMLEMLRMTYRAYGDAKPLKKLYPFTDNKRVWIVLSEVDAKEDGEYFNKASPIDGVYTFDDLSDYMRRIGLARVDFDTRFSSDLSDQQYEDHLVLIGGYENNRVSNQLRLEHGDKRSFCLENNCIIEGGRKKRSWGVSLDDNGRIIKDYCLVTKINNPFSNNFTHKSWILAFEGVRQFGTIGAVNHWNPQIMKSFRRLDYKPKVDDTIEAVLELNVQYNGGQPQVLWSEIKALYVNGAEL
ncbi:MAG: hypothetical protein KUG54_01750 [Gammaproteobacteria bacterium]|nr:hypothetical protein [Gammaproteobacteria bacterium]